MPDHEKPPSDEEFQSGEMSEEDLEKVAAGTTYDVTMKMKDDQGTQVEIFQKPAAT